jgi:TRAP-type mannitol/chloroaromatic compound transport system permease large subunit
MLFGLFIGATAFSYVFALLGGHELILEIISATGADAWSVLIVLMIAVFILGFFFDWIEITLIILPVFAPIIASLDFGSHVENSGLMIAWFATLMAVNLQTSFLTPPFGFALFYMKGAAPKSVKLGQIYRGIIPFVLLQIFCLAVLTIWPKLALWLPTYMGH